MKTVAIIQARCESTRLPNKVLAGIGDRSLLAHVVRRAERIEGVDQVVVAFPEGRGEDVLEWECDRLMVSWVRGHPTDVLARYLKAARAFEADVLVRVTADCWALCPTVSARVVAATQATREYAWTSGPESRFPEGLDTEAFTREDLQWADNFSEPPEREHVTPALRRRGPVHLIKNEGPDLSAWKLSVDTLDDLARARRIYKHLRDGWDWPDLRDYLTLRGAPDA